MVRVAVIFGITTDHFATDKLSRGEERGCDALICLQAVRPLRISDKRNRMTSASMTFVRRKFMRSYIGTGMSTMCALGMFILCVLPLAWAPKAEALPSYARQTGLPCSGCHTTPPELNAAGRLFKLMGYIDRQKDTSITAEGDKRRSGLNMLQTLPLGAWFETSLTNTKAAQPGTQNGNFEFPQDISLFLAGAWSSHIGSFLQVTYNAQDDHFSADNTDIRYANKKQINGKDWVYGLTLNNNPTVEDLWNSPRPGVIPLSSVTRLLPLLLRRSSQARWRRTLPAWAPSPCGTSICTSTRQFIAPIISAALSPPTEQARPLIYAAWHLTGVSRGRRTGAKIMSKSGSTECT